MTTATPFAAITTASSAAIMIELLKADWGAEMINDDAIKLIKARYEAVNAHDWDRFQRFYADSIFWDDSGLPEPIRGPAAVRERLEALVTAFPDLHWNLDQLFGDGENVCAEFTFTGTHQGELPNNCGGKMLPPTGKTVRIKACGVYRVEEGNITKSAVYFDFGELTK